MQKKNVIRAKNTFMKIENAILTQENHNNNNDKRKWFRTKIRKLTFPYWAPASKIATEPILSILFDVFLFPIVDSYTRFTIFQTVLFNYPTKILRVNEWVRLLQ